MRGSVWFDALSDVSDHRLVSLSQDNEALSLVNEPWKYYSNMTPLEYVLKSGHIFKNTAQIVKRIRFLITVCGARVENYYLDCTRYFDCQRFLHKYGARFKCPHSFFTYIHTFCAYNTEAAAVECALFYPHFWNTVPGERSYDPSLIRRIMNIARHRSDGAHKARMAMLSLTYGGTKHLSKDMLRLVIGHMKNPKYVANPAWGVSWKDALFKHVYSILFCFFFFVAIFSPK
jgi:hypothetical protein